MFELIGCSAVVFLFVVAEPFIYVKRMLGFRDEFYTTYTSTKQFVHRLIYCCLCSGFWIGYICTQSIYSSAIISICAEIIYRCDKKFNI